jgi:hypothetical protein
MLWTLPCPGSFVTALRVLFPLAIVIVIGISKMALSTTWISTIRPVIIIIVLIDYLIPIQQSYGQEVAWLILPAAW